MNKGDGNTDAESANSHTGKNDEERGSANSPSQAAVDVGEVVEVVLLPLFTPDAQVSLEYPARVYCAQNRDQLRALLGRLVRDGALEVPRIRTNDAGEITELTWKLPAPERDRTEPTKPSLLSRFLEGSGKFVGLLSTLAALWVTAYVIVPDLKPDPPPSVLGATLSTATLEERGGGGSAQDPRYFVVSVDIEFIGFKDNEVRLEWVGLDAGTLERVPLEAPQGWANPVKVVPEAPNDRINEQVRVRVPDEGRCLFVRFYAFDEGGARLDFTDTAPFDTHGGDRCPTPAEASRTDA